MLACKWARIGEEESFVGRCAETGDDLGAAVVAARLVRDLMRLCLLMGRRYPPYAKWLGTAFARLPEAGDLGPVLRGALSASPDHLVRAYEMVARRHNDLGLTPPVDPRVRAYHNRPYRVLMAGRFAAALVEGITDPAVRGLPLTGAIDQFVDSTAVLTNRSLTGRIGHAVAPADPA